jgi:hypothetical protein
MLVMSQVPGLGHVTFYRHPCRYPTLFHSFDDESRVFIVEACAPIILALAMTEIELPLTTCAITSITKLAEPVMTRSHVSILFSGPLRPSLHTTPHTGLHQGQGLGNPLCYPRLPILYTLTRQHSELVFFPDSELRAQTVRHIQEPTT